MRFSKHPHPDTHPHKCEKKFNDCFRNLKEIVTLIDVKSKKTKEKEKNKENKNEMFVVKFEKSIKDDGNLKIIASDLSQTFCKKMNENAMIEHLKESGFVDCPWKTYFETLEKSLTNVTNTNSNDSDNDNDNDIQTINDNLSINKGKGGGYVILNISYRISENITLHGQIQLDLSHSFQKEVCQISLCV